MIIRDLFIPVHDKLTRYQGYLPKGGHPLLVLRGVHNWIVTKVISIQSLTTICKLYRRFATNELKNIGFFIWKIDMEFNFILSIYQIIQKLKTHVRVYTLGVKGLSCGIDGMSIRCSVNWFNTFFDNLWLYLIERQLSFFNSFF
jgi:hypothetical protein